ncbi:Geranylgeranyl pyrophosphate synthase [Halotydeus destructor]|nr:Geranylgeranyl pyrophosphate synthase [Halotydeus destructor]
MKLTLSEEEAFNLWLQVPEDQSNIVSEIVEMLHNASLLIDDIEDNSVLRRGIPVAHNIFGVPSTINSANYVYFLALEKVVAKMPSQLTQDAVKVFTEQLLELHRGQGMDIHWRDNVQCPTEEEYLRMIARKTGGLFGLGVRLLQLFSTEKKDFTGLIQLMGTYFQIRDDYCNLMSTEYAENKSFCEDLTEGKFSFPIVHAIQTKSTDPSLLNILKQRTKSLELKKYAVQLLQASGSFEYTLNILNKLDSETRAEIALLGGNDHLIALLNELKLPNH